MLKQQAANLLSRLLDLDPDHRFNTRDVLIHEFLRGGNTPTMKERSLEGLRREVGMLASTEVERFEMVSVLSMSP